MMPDAYQDISVPEKAVTLNLGSSHSVKTYLPKDGAAATGQVAAVTSYNLSVPDHPLIVELMPKKKRR